MTSQRAATDAERGQSGSSPALHAAGQTSTDTAPNGATDRLDTQVETRSTSETTPLLSQEDTEVLLERWSAVQAGFVDSPQQAVQQADALVTETIERLMKGFADERNQLEGQWSAGQDASTEDLRIALQRYRSFFTRLLSL